MKIYIVCCNDAMLSAWLDEGLANAEVDRLKAEYEAKPAWEKGYGVPYFHVHDVPLFVESDHGGALVLSRAVGENIIIHPLVGDPINVLLVSILSDRKARIGVKAQKGVRIDRQEVYEARQRGKARQAATAEKRQESGGKR